MISYLVSVKAFKEKNRTKLSNDFIFGFQERTIRHGNAKTLPSKTSRPICCIIAAKNTFIPHRDTSNNPTWFCPRTPLLQRGFLQAANRSRRREGRSPCTCLWLGHRSKPVWETAIEPMALVLLVWPESQIASQCLVRIKTGKTQSLED